MKKLLIIFMIFLLSASVYAQEKKVLGIYMTDGTMVCFLLNEKPVLAFVDDAVKVVSTSEEALIKRSLVDHFEFLAETAKLESFAVEKCPNLKVAYVPKDAEVSSSAFYGVHNDFRIERY